MKTFISFSGGLDSTYALWKELTETSNDVTAVFFKCPSMRMDWITHYKITAFMGPLESLYAADRIHQFADKIASFSRPFKMVIQEYDWSYLVNPNTGSNNSSVIRVRWAIDQINSGVIDKFVSGSCRENDAFSNGFSASKDGQTGSNQSLAEFKEKAKRGEYAFPLFDMNYAIAHAYAELPQEITNSHLSCEVSYIEGSCGECYKCRYHQLAKNKLAEGHTPEEFFNFFMEKSDLKNGMWKSPKQWVYEELNIPCGLGELNPWAMPQWPNSYKVPE